MLIASKTQIENIQTMSSREIAELCKKEHKNVLRVIRELIDAHILVAQIEPLKFEYRGQQFDYYELNKRDSMVVVARLSPEFMAAVVDRWQELEAQASKPVDPMAALSDPNMLFWSIETGHLIKHIVQIQSAFYHPAWYANGGRCNKRYTPAHQQRRLLEMDRHFPSTTPASNC